MKRTNLILISILLISITSLASSQNSTGQVENNKFYLRITAGGGGPPSSPREGLMITIINNCYNLYRDGSDTVGAILDTNITLSDSVVSSLSQFIDSTGYFTLAPAYINRDCMDGGGASVYIRSRGISKSVYLQCYTLKSISMIIEKVLRLAGGI